MKRTLGLLGLFLSTVVVAADAPPALSLAAETQRQQAAAYEAGVATWKDFIAHGWATRSPGNGDLGILRLQGTLSATVEIVLGVVDGKAGFAMNPPEHALKTSLPMLEFGMGLNFEAAYYVTEPIAFPDGRRINDERLDRAICRLVFEAGVLKENGCAGAAP